MHFRSDSRIRASVVLSPAGKNVPNVAANVLTITKTFSHSPSIIAAVEKAEFTEAPIYHGYGGS